jgi:MFS family permease
MISSQNKAHNNPMWSKLPVKLKILLLSMILANIGGRLYRPFMPLYILSLGGTVTQVGVFFTVNSISAAILRPLGGWFSDSIGRMQAVGIGTLFGLAGMLGYAISPTWEWLIVSAIVLAFGRAIVGPSFRAFTAEVAPEGQLAQTFGLVNGVFNIVNVIGPALGGWIVTQFGLSALFWVAVVFMLSASILRVSVALGQSYHWEQVRFSGLKAGLSGMLMGMIAGGLLTWLLITDSLRDFGISLYDNLQPVLMNEWGLSESQIGLLFSLFALVYLVVSLFGSRLADRWSAAGSLAVGGLIEAGSLILLLTNPTAAVFPLYFVVSGIGIGLADPAFDALLARSAPKGFMGMTFGTFRMATSFLAMPAPYIGALLWDNVDPLAPFAIGAVFIIAASILTWVGVRPHAKQSREVVSEQEG